MPSFGIPENVTNVLSRMQAIEARLQELAPPVASPDAASARPSFSDELNRAMHAANPAMARQQAVIAQAAAKHNIRPELLAALVQIESGGNEEAVSPKGAMGLTQLMPGTAVALGVNDPFDPEENVMAGAKYLRQQLDRFNGDERQALAAYNAGPGAVARYHGVPPYAETQRYVTNILALADQTAAQP